MEVALPDISNRVGSVKHFLNELLPALRRGESFFSFLFLCIDDHGSFVISRSVSVRPKHLFDQNFDHDYFFKLPWPGSAMPIQVDGVLLPTLSGTELSRVRTELQRRRILTSVSPHPVQAHPQPASHRYLGNALVPSHG